MHEKKKLDEANYFYSRMVQEKANLENLTYNFSAFLSASRSVLQYTFEEAKTKKGGQMWYDSLMASSNTLRYFKDKRDLNIHSEPIVVEKHFKVTKIFTFLHSLPGITEKILKIGMKSEQKKEPEPEVRYVFSDWNGSEDIFELSKMYIQQLENLISDRVSKGFISG